MPRKSIGDGLVTGGELRAMLERNRLRQRDAAWIVGKGERMVRGWCLSTHPVPQYAALLLAAYDQGLITAKWLGEHIGRPPPA